MVRDSDPRKWIYKEHTQAKHELLEKYLSGWLPILGRWHTRLAIIDGFAGRGEYVDGSPGSPVTILEKAQELLSAGKVGEVVCAFIEMDHENFVNLETVLAKIKPRYPDVKIAGPVNSAFEPMAWELISAVGDALAPSFWFIDPFGFTGMSFDTIKLLMSLKRSEVFITLMLRDIARFLNHPNLDETFDRLYGTSNWREILDSGQTGESKEHQLRDLYISQLRSIGCKVTVFRVCMDEKSQTLYYMVHATKHPKGRWLMKDVMSRQGANGLFAYLGPKDQVTRLQGTLLPADDISALKSQLLDSYAGLKTTFDQLLDECCDDNELRQPDYRKALKELRQEEKIEIESVTSKTSRGLQGMDLIKFPPN